MWSVSAVFSPPRRSHAYPLHRRAALVAGSRWLGKTRAARWGTAAPRTHDFVFAVRRPAAADTRRSGINRASEQGDIPARRECLQLLEPSLIFRPARRRTPWARNERYRRNVRRACSADRASAA